MIEEFYIQKQGEGQKKCETTCYMNRQSGSDKAQWVDKLYNPLITFVSINPYDNHASFFVLLTKFFRAKCGFSK